MNFATNHPPRGIIAFACTIMCLLMTTPATGNSMSSSAPTALFLGDSYTYGEGAGTPLKRFSTLTAQAMAWREVNLAVGGTGYLAQCWVKGKLQPNYAAVLKSTSIQPDFVIVSGGRNDKWNPKTATAIQTFFSSLRAKYPNAQLVATSPIWDARRQPPAKMNFLKSAVRAAASSNGVAYIDLQEPLSGRYEYLTKDWVHPNARGHAALATELIKGLKSLYSQ